MEQILTKYIASDFGDTLGPMWYLIYYGKIGHFRTFCALSQAHVVLEQYKDLFLNGIVNSFRTVC